MESPCSMRRCVSAAALGGSLSIGRGAVGLPRLSQWTLLPRTLSAFPPGTSTTCQPDQYTTGNLINREHAEPAAARANEMDAGTVDRELPIGCEVIEQWQRRGWSECDPPIGIERAAALPVRAKGPRDSGSRCSIDVVSIGSRAATSSGGPR
ncbi:hypothetical protein [Streptomyces sp. NPDC048332]|uniref:hypothetical protein n=1 Tax=unclassified Streptomyces TaxID=2593676 RepID=UPI0034168CBC